MMDLIAPASPRHALFKWVCQFLVYLVCINLLIFGANLAVWGVWLGRRLVCTNRGMGSELNLNGGEQYFLQAVRWLLGKSRASLGNIRREFGCSKGSTFFTSAYWMLWGFVCVPLGGVGVVCSVVCSAASSFVYACLAVAFFSAGNVIFLLSGVVAFFSQTTPVCKPTPANTPQQPPLATAPDLDDQGGSGAALSGPWPALASASPPPVAPPRLTAGQTASSQTASSQQPNSMTDGLHQRIDDMVWTHDGADLMPAVEAFWARLAGCSNSTRRSAISHTANRSAEYYWQKTKLARIQKRLDPEMRESVRPLALHYQGVHDRYSHAHTRFLALDREQLQGLC